MGAARISPLRIVSPDRPVLSDRMAVYFWTTRSIKPRDCVSIA